MWSQHKFDIVLRCHREYWTLFNEQGQHKMIAVILRRRWLKWSRSIARRCRPGFRDSLLMGGWDLGEICLFDWKKVGNLCKDEPHNLFQLFATKVTKKRKSTRDAVELIRSSWLTVDGRLRWVGGLTFWLKKGRNEGKDRLHKIYVSCSQWRWLQSEWVEEMLWRCSGHRDSLLMGIRTRNTDCAVSISFF